MRKRLIYIGATLLLAVLLALLVWQSSFSFGDFTPSSPEQTYTVWAVSTLIFILTVTLGFMLVRNFVKLWIDHRRNREGSRIRTKLVLGALALTITPVVFLVFFSIGVLNINLRRWFTQPAENIKLNYMEIGRAIERENQSKAQALAMWVFSSAEAEKARQDVKVDLAKMCEQRADRGVTSGAGKRSCHLALRACGARQGRVPVEARYGDVVLRTAPVLDLAHIQSEIGEAIRKYHQLASDQRAIKNSYLQLLVSDYAVHPVLRDMAGIVSLETDQRSDHGAACCRPGDPQRKSGHRGEGRRGRRTGVAGACVQRNDAGAGGEQPRTGEPAAIHRGDSREHSDRRHLADRRRAHPASESSVEGSSRRDAVESRQPRWRTCSRRKTRRRSDT